MAKQVHARLDADAKAKRDKASRLHADRNTAAGVLDLAIAEDVNSRKAHRDAKDALDAHQTLIRNAADRISTAVRQMRETGEAGDVVANAAAGKDYAAARLEWLQLNAVDQATGHTRIGSINLELSSAWERCQKAKPAREEAESALDAAEALSDAAAKERDEAERALGDAWRKLLEPAEEALALVCWNAFTCPETAPATNVPHGALPSGYGFDGTKTNEPGEVLKRFIFMHLLANTVDDSKRAGNRRFGYTGVWDSRLLDVELTKPENPQDADAWTVWHGSPKNKTGERLSKWTFVEKQMFDKLVKDVFGF
jgi:hypothetical protein